MASLRALMYEFQSALTELSGLSFSSWLVPEVAIGISLSKYEAIALTSRPEGFCTALLCAFSFAQIAFALEAKALRESVSLEPHPATAIAVTPATSIAGRLMLRVICSPRREAARPATAEISHGWSSSGFRSPCRNLAGRPIRCPAANDIAH